MQILITGGTGFIGRNLCKELVERDHTVTAMARSKPTESLPAGVELVTGDVREPTDVEDAIEGQDAVYNLVALSPLFKAPRGAHDAVHRQGTQHLIEAATQAGVDRFVQMSALGADPNGTTEYLRAKGEAEAIVKASDLDWTIVRPSVVFGDGAEFVDFTKWVSFPPMLSGLWWPYITPLPGARARFEPIWSEDLVGLLAEIIESAEHNEQTYEFGGPETMTLADIVRLIHQAEHKSARILPIPTVLAKIPLAIGQHIPGFPLGSDQGRSLDIDNVTTSNDVDRFGRDPAELESLRAYLGGNKR